MDENALIAFLERLTPADFSRILTRFPEVENQLPDKASHLERVAALIRYVRSPNGPGISYLMGLVHSLFPHTDTRPLRKYLEDLIDFIKDRVVEELLPLARDTPSEVTSPISRQRERHQRLAPPLQLSKQSFLTTGPTEEEQIFDTFDKAFEKQQRRTLLLGAPGAGKTTTLYQFTLQAAKVCLESLASPQAIPSLIPLFTYLHEWDHKTPLREWVHGQTMEEFCGPYTPDGNHRECLYIFDGLDELGGEHPLEPENPASDTYDPRHSFLEALAEQLPDAPVIVSCRVADYGQLREKATLQGAVTLLPLNSGQIERFLRDQNQSFLWDALTNDDDLIELTRTPLLLVLLSIAVGSDQKALSWNSTTLTASTLFDFYIHQRFEHEANKRTLPFDEKTARRWLGQLAAHLWTGPRTSAVALYPYEIKSILGVTQDICIDFLCSMHFLRRMPSSMVQFLHLKLRDFCAIPTLLEALKDQDTFVRGRASEALGNIGDASAIPALREALKDQNIYVRGKAALALGNIGDASAVPALLEALQDHDTFVRGKAALALGNIGDASAVPALREALRNQDTFVRQSATEVIGKMGQPAIPALLEALQDRYADVRGKAALALGNIGDASAVPALLEALQDRYTDVRRKTALALGNIGDASAVPALLEALQDYDTDVWRKATEALGKIGQPAIPALREALTDYDTDVRQRVALALGNIGDASAVPALLEALRNQDTDVWRKATEALGKIGQPAIPALLEAVKNQDTNVRRKAALALGNIGDTSAVPAFLEALRNPDTFVRGKAALALERVMNSDRAISIDEMQ